jgi:hypothetical protein
MANLCEFCIRNGQLKAKVIEEILIYKLPQFKAEQTNKKSSINVKLADGERSIKSQETY